MSTIQDLLIQIIYKSDCTLACDLIFQSMRMPFNMHDYMSKYLLFTLSLTIASHNMYVSYKLLFLALVHRVSLLFVQFSF